MRKIPTLFRRDPNDMSRVLPEVHPDCQWVLDGEGVATWKYDGTCVLFDGERWWARREVKPGKTAPPDFEPVQTDDVTGKTMGWEPIEQSAFAKYHAEAVAQHVTVGDWEPGTYELVGPKVNGNPEMCQQHELWAHAAADQVDAPRDFEGLARFLADFAGEGLVWHHPDGRMAKLKRKDFPR
jgi:hypothetical protein